MLHDKLGYSVVLYIFCFILLPKLAVAGTTPFVFMQGHNEQTHKDSGSWGWLLTDLLAFESNNQEKIFRKKNQDNDTENIFILWQSHDQIGYLFVIVDALPYDLSYCAWLEDQVSAGHQGVSFFFLFLVCSRPVISCKNGVCALLAWCSFLELPR